MATNMRQYSWNSLTYLPSLAEGVVKEAFKDLYPQGYTIHHEKDSIIPLVKIGHYHWVNPVTGHLGGVTGLSGVGGPNHDRPTVVHSYHMNFGI